MKLIWMTLIGLLITACTQADSSELSVVVVSPAELSELLKTDSRPQLIDVRTPDEFKEGHIKGALNVDIKAASFSKQIALLDRDKPYIVHCKSGGRSTKSIKIWKELGFTKVYHLNVGFDGWKQAGLLVSE